ncbi:cytosolic endo-beta-N-acetylglucosaminidase-like isoform X2 [Dreissena polymorpha]|nr:cytosolic endo-beta-N-acetylglucosaminidase-like isoform X2 [Dreissena polymorpha]
MDKRNPQCRPLFDLDEVLSWKPDKDPFCVAGISRRPRKILDNPKILVCHDMHGGYLEDRLVQGCGRPGSYRFYHWQIIDTFVYFSHYFVTIPPPSWTNAAHRHGVKILGTVITEWDDGKARCAKILESEASYKQFADQLVKIAEYYRFDGWLINIENAIESSDAVERLRGFVGYLTTVQHQSCSESEVIWYDSVLNSGKLDWQNALNAGNQIFFDACDGIFLNYCWTEEHLLESKKNALECNRPFDVYVGIDVFGRGCPGGGGFNTVETLTAARKHNLSAAIFAHSWVYDKLDVKQFTENEDKFWQLLGHLCSPCCYTSLPLSTTFCQGFGERFFDNGMPVGNPWFNMSVQQLQPCFIQSHGKSASVEQNKNQSRIQIPRASVTSEQNPGIVDGESQPEMGVCTDDSFIGGSCLRLTADIGNSQFVKYSLFSLDVQLKQYSSVYVSFTYKILQDPDCDIFYELHLQHDAQSIVLVLLPFPDGDKPVPIFGKDMACMYVHAIPTTSLPKLLSVSTPQQNNTRWRTRWFPVHSLYLKFCRLTSVKVGMTTTDPQPKKCIALLGDFKLISVESLPSEFPAVVLDSVTPDLTSSYPLIDEACNNYNKEDQVPAPESVNWGVDASGNAITIPYDKLDSMRVSCHTLQDFRPGIGGQLCQVLYQLITSLDCFTLKWKSDNPDTVDHYRIYQIKIDSGVAKLMGHVLQPIFKVTWFEIPDYERNESVHHFKFVVRPVLKCGVVVPLDYAYCKLFQVASRKDSPVIVTDSYPGMLETEQGKQTAETGKDSKMVEKQSKDTNTLENLSEKLLDDQDLGKGCFPKGRESEKPNLETEQCTAGEENLVHDVCKKDECDSENVESTSGARANSDIENLTQKLQISDS